MAESYLVPVVDISILDSDGFGAVWPLPATSGILTWNRNWDRQATIRFSVRTQNRNFRCWRSGRDSNSSDK
jgi:hypothetical protein